MLSNWNIRNQILIPVTVVFLSGIIASTWINVNKLIVSERNRIKKQAADLFTTMSEKSFPLHDSVLRQIENISGFHSVIFSNDSDTTSSFAEFELKELLNHLSLSTDSDPPEIVSIGLEDYFVFSNSFKTENTESTIYAFYPRKILTDSIRSSVTPQIITGIVTILLVTGLVLLISRNVTAPIRSLQKHVAEISDGNFSSQNEVKRKDEIGDLFRSINEMSQKLEQYEHKIRDQEKLFTLDQMGGGIAHQMRNSITGCRLALDVHRESCESDPESLSIAARQLKHMESFQQKFLSLGRSPTEKPKPLDLAALITQYVPLLEPVAKHVAVELSFSQPHHSVVVLGYADRIEQMLGNLVLNGIDAASAGQNAELKSVDIQLAINKDAIDDERAVISVTDSGDGVATDMQDRLFQALATDKPDGVGLGLAIVKQTADQHDGEVSWIRNNGCTTFFVSIPLFNQTDSNQENL